MRQLSNASIAAELGRVMKNGYRDTYWTTRWRQEAYPTLFSDGHPDGHPDGIKPSLEVSDEAGICRCSIDSLQISATDCGWAVSVRWKIVPVRIAA